MRAVPLLLLSVSLPATAEVRITPQGDRVSVHAVAAPLSDVLEQLSRTTGMKVIYEGAAPRLPVTVTVEARTPVEAVLAVMEGQGLNFGLRSDAAGHRVDRLLIAGQAQASGKPTPSTPVPPQGAPIDAGLTFDQDESVDEKGEEDPEPNIKLPPPATRAPAPPAGPAFQAPPQPVYPNSPFAPQPQAPMPPPPPPPPLPQPEPEDEKELD